MSNKDYNSHLVTPLSKSSDYINVDGPVVSFSIQSGPIAANGKNGCDATDIIRYSIELYRSFNKAFPCRENSLTMTKLEEALHWQEARTRDRIAREVEGTDAE